MALGELAVVGRVTVAYLSFALPLCCVLFRQARRRVRPGGSAVSLPPVADCLCGGGRSDARLLPAQFVWTVQTLEQPHLSVPSPLCLGILPAHDPPSLSLARP